MPGLYQRLFTYRERALRSPLEDFLSEALADLLNRLPEEIARQAVAHLLCKPQADLAGLSQRWPAGAETNWTTQTRIDDGRVIDLLLNIDSKPTLAVENKIAAGFQSHEGGERSQGQHQLATYGKWLADRSGTQWGGGLVLLTHWTPAPADFLDPRADYGCRHRGVARWARLSRWLKVLIQDNNYKNAKWKEFARELIWFLREHNMDSELATGHDFAALQIYTSSADRIRNSIEQIWDSSKDIWRPICQQNEFRLEVSTKYGCVWKYRYLKGKGLKQCFLAAGIRYPGTGDAGMYPVDDIDPYLFVEIGSDVDDSPIDRLLLPEDWHASNALRLARYSVRKLPTDPEKFLEKSKEWVRSRIVEASRLLS